MTLIQTLLMVIACTVIIAFVMIILILHWHIREFNKELENIDFTFDEDDTYY